MRACAVSDCKAAASGQKADCHDRECRRSVQQLLRNCIRDATARLGSEGRTIRSGSGQCSRCCQQTCGEGDCRDYFSASRFYGSYRNKGGLHCLTEGSPSAFLGATGALRQRLATLVPFLVARWNH